MSPLRVACNFNFGPVDLRHRKCTTTLLASILYAGIDSREIKNILVGVLIILFFACKTTTTRRKKISSPFETIEGLTKYIVPQCTHRPALKRL